MKVEILRSKATELLFRVKKREKERKAEKNKERNLDRRMQIHFSGSPLISITN